MVPATRSGIDVAFWLLEKAGAEKIQITMPKLRWLLYLAQAHYAVAKSGAKLMPATFLVGEDGPTEPTIELVLTTGVKNAWRPELNETALAFLEGFWVRFGALPVVALHRLIVADPAWKKGLDGGLGAELHVAELHSHDRERSGIKLPTASEEARRKAEVEAFQAEVQAKMAARHSGRHALTRTARRDAAELERSASTGPRTSAEKGAEAYLRAVPPETQEIRFTADGRSVTRWKPKRRVTPPAKQT